MVLAVTIDNLTGLVAPPPHPVGADCDWALTEGALGLRLPADFKALVSHYGVGQFGDIGLWDTLTGGVSRFVELAYRDRDHLRQLREQFPGDFPYPFYPEPGGLLEWASTGSGDRLCWLTEGEPDGWPVVVWNLREGAYRYDVGAVDLLHAFLGGQLEIDLLGPTSEVPWFEPYRQRSSLSVRLSESELPNLERLRILRTVLAPTADRGGFGGDDGVGQHHFKVLDSDWLVTYGTGLSHYILMEVLPGDEHLARVAVVDAAQAMGCQVLDPRG
jgi:hypothetical protein